MPLSRDVEEQLRSIAYVDTVDPGNSSELVESLESLAEAADLAVSSLLAVGVTAAPGVLPVTLLTAAGRQPEDASPVVAAAMLSLRLPGRQGASVTLYADRPGSLDQLAADLPRLLDVHRREAVLTADQPVPSIPDSAQEWADRLAGDSALNQALGVMLVAGYPLADGREELHARARARHLSLVDAARQLLREQSPRAAPPFEGRHREGNVE